MDYIEDLLKINDDYNFERSTLSSFIEDMMQTANALVDDVEEEIKRKDILPKKKFSASGSMLKNKKRRAIFKRRGEKA